MSAETILSRMMSDAKFADAVFTDPTKALAEYNLTAEEAANLKAVTRAEFDKYVQASPEERKSMGAFNHNETALTI